MAVVALTTTTFLKSPDYHDTTFFVLFCMSCHYEVAVTFVWLSPSSPVLPQLVYIPVGVLLHPMFSLHVGVNLMK